MAQPVNGAMVAKHSRQQTGHSRKDAGSVWQRAVRAVDGMDIEVFSELLNGLWSGCGRKDPPDRTTLQVWYSALHDLTEAEMAAAVMLYLRTRSKEFLTIQLIRELSGVMPVKELAALEAWGSALDAIRIVGGFAVPRFADSVVSHVVANLGGWVWFCDQRPEELRGFVRQRFLKAYEVLSQGARITEPARLLSLTDSGGASIRIAGKPTSDRIQ